MKPAAIILLLIGLAGCSKHECPRSIVQWPEKIIFNPPAELIQLETTLVPPSSKAYIFAIDFSSDSKRVTIYKTRP